MDEKYWFFIGFTRLWMKSVDFTLVLRGCGCKLLVFTVVVDDNGGFSLVFM